MCCHFQTPRTNSLKFIIHFNCIFFNIFVLGFSRPRRLLVFINPISGRKKGVKIYREHMAPLCKLCSVECDVIGKSQFQGRIFFVLNYGMFKQLCFFFLGRQKKVAINSDRDNSQYLKRKKLCLMDCKYTLFEEYNDNNRT